MGVAVKRARALFSAAARTDDEGSVLILTLGYALLALAAVFVCVDATSLYLAQKRLDSLADSAALAGSDGFTLEIVDGEPIARLTDQDVHSEAATFLADIADPGTALVAATTPDGVSARVTVASTWRPPILALFVPDGVAIEAPATSRTALD